MQKQLEITRTLHFDDLRKLGNVEGPCITVSLALEPAPNTSRMDFQRLNAGIRQAEQKLQENWPDLSREARRGLIEPLGEVGNNAEGWGGDGGSLVILRSPDVFRAFEIPQELNEMVVVGDFFHIFPMFHALKLAEQTFYLLALSQNNVRLLRCTRTTSDLVPLPPDTPTSLEEWLNTRSPNSAPSHGTSASGEAGSTGGSFTSTTDVDNKDQHIANFYRVINKAVFETLRNHNEPLVICGVEYELTMYRQINTYPHLWEEGVQGSPDGLKGGEMHARALEAVQDFFAQPAKKALTQWEKLGGDVRTSTSFPDIVKAAFEGRIQALFAKQNAQAMGVFDREVMEMRVQGRQEDLVNAAALQTLAFGGDVYILDPEHVPGGQQLAALFRY